MLEKRLTELQNNYDRNSSKIASMCISQNTSLNKLEELRFLVRRICGISKALCTDISNSFDSPILLREALTLDYLWGDLLAYVENVIDKRTKTAA